MSLAKSSSKSRPDRPQPQTTHGSLFQKVEKLRANLETVIRGKTGVLDMVLVALISGESILIEDVPGVGKTTLAKALAASIELDFQRIQCTPDLLPADIFGVSIFNPLEGEFRFRRGPVFCNILLVDEINRASPRTQSALLEAMAEKQVTVEGKRYELPNPFLVIATQNPYGYHGTFPLPESQLDRFLMQVSMDYPDRATEKAILYQETAERPLEKMTPVLTREDAIGFTDELKGIRFDESLADYLLSIVDATRNDSRVELGCSPRGSISFFQAAKASAVVDGRNYVTPDDIQKIAPMVLRHRIVLAGRKRNDDVAVDAMIREWIQASHVPV